MFLGLLAALLGAMGLGGGGGGGKNASPVAVSTREDSPQENPGPAFVVESVPESQPTAQPQVQPKPQFQPQTAPELGPQPFILLAFEAPEITAGRIATLQPKDPESIAQIRLIEGPTSGKVIVNPDNTLAVVLSYSDTTDNISYSYEITRSDGSVERFEAHHAVVVDPTVSHSLSVDGTADHEMPMDDGEHDHAAVENCDEDDGGSSGPCPKTGDPVCHCSTEDEDEDAHDHAGHEMPMDGEEHEHAGHEMPMDGEEHDHAGHEMGGDASTPITAPTTPAEIDAFVAAVRSTPEVHIHDMGSSMAGEHMAAMDLVLRADATHIAIGDGDWNDPSNWHNGEVPGDNAKALIPEGVHMIYADVSDARLFTLRVDGHLDFATDVDSQMIVDTIVITPSGTLTIGTEAEPVDPSVNVDIIFANNGPIDTDWDPMLLSRGMISHGKTEIHGTEKDSHEKVIDDPQAGDTWVDFGETPTGWAVGDTIVIAGTRYDGYKWDGAVRQVRHYDSEDEVRVITQIEDGLVFFDEPLVFDHAGPRDDLKTSVANYTRNVSFETENAETAEIFERGHVMFMHNDDVDVHYAEFHELGRTDKSETALNVSEFEEITFDANVKGRYSFHFHRSGVDDLEDPAIASGNAVYGSPGWGFVHHDSNAIFDNNATFDTFGAGYVAESGNETGAWTNNIAIFAQGNSWEAPKNGNDLSNFDLGQTGDGFWFQGRMVESSDNIAASVNTGFVYFHRGGSGETQNINFDSELFEFSSALYEADSVHSNSIPIISFANNEAFASKEGLHVVKASPIQGHDIHSIFENFTAWNVKSGAHFEYTAHYIIKDFDLIGADPVPFSRAYEGISFGTNTLDMTVINPTISGFETGISLFKSVTSGIMVNGQDFTVIDPNITDVIQVYKHYDPELDTITTSDDLPYLQPDIVIDEPLRVVQDGGYGVRGVSIDGTKFDSLGETDFASDWEQFHLHQGDVARLLEENGYYETSQGEDYFVLDLFFSDRLTGDIYLERHPVFMEDNGLLGNPYHIYKDAVYNGVQNLDGSINDPTFDAAKLWATLTNGQITLTEEALLDEEGTLSEAYEQEMFFDDVFAL